MWTRKCTVINVTTTTTLLSTTVDWPCILHVCILRGNLLYSTVILSSVYIDYVVFYADQAANTDFFRHNTTLNSILLQFHGYFHRCSNVIRALCLSSVTRWTPSAGVIWHPPEMELGHRVTVIVSDKVVWPGFGLWMFRAIRRRPTTDFFSVVYDNVLLLWMYCRLKFVPL